MRQSLNLSWKIAAETSGCVFAYFCGGHKSNFRLQFRGSFKHDKSYKKKSSYIIKIEVQLWKFNWNSWSN